MSQELQQARDRKVAANAKARQAVAAYLKVRFDMSTTAAVNMDAPQHRRAVVAKALDDARAARKAAADESKGAEAAAPRLAELRDVEREAAARRVSREQVLSERMLPAARFTPAVVPKVFRHNPDAPSALLRDAAQVAALNAQEMANYLAAEQLEEAKRTRVAAELRQGERDKAHADRLARVVTEAAARGDGAMVEACRRELETWPAARNDAERAIRNPAVIAVGRAGKSLPLSTETVEELDLLDDVAAADIELGSIRSEMATGEQSNAAKSARVSEVGAEVYLAEQRANREAAAIAARAGRAPADNPPAPPAEPPAAPPAA